MTFAKEYFFKRPAVDVADELCERFRKLGQYWESEGLISKWKKSYDFYYGRMFSTDGTVPGLGIVGESGEFTTININHLRNIMKHTIGLVTQNKLAFDSQARNSDISSRYSAVISNQVLDYYYHTERFEEEVRSALELSMIFGTAFIHTSWNPAKNLVDVDEFGGGVYAGAPEMVAKGPLDILIEPYKTKFNTQNWVVVRDIENRYDLASEYPEHAEEILELPRITDVQHVDPMYLADEEACFVYRAYHKETTAIPYGRYIKFCDNSVVLEDGPNPYDGKLPVHCVRPDLVYGSAYGHTAAFDLIPVQEGISLIDSTILSNQKAFGSQNVLVPKRSGMTKSDLEGGLRVIEYDANPDLPNAGKPEALQLCSTPRELFEHREKLITDAERISGINSAVRGMPPTQLTSGTAIALVSTQATSYNTNLEMAYHALVEDTASFLIGMLAKYMQIEEIIAISGAANSGAAKVFKGEDLKGVQRVRVQTGNAVAKTVAGRVDMAEKLLQNGLLTTPGQFVEVLKSGTVAPMLEDQSAEDDYIATENEAMLQGSAMPVVYTDNPMKHILLHRALLFRPEVRGDQAISGVVMQHITEHMDQLDKMSVTNPTLLTLIAEGKPILPQPLPETRVGNANGGEGGPGGNIAGGQAPAPTSPMGGEGESTPQASQSADVAQEQGAEPVAAAGLKRALNQAMAAQAG